MQKQKHYVRHVGCALSPAVFKPRLLLFTTNETTSSAFKNFKEQDMLKYFCRYIECRLLLYNKISLKTG